MATEIVAAMTADEKAEHDSDYQKLLALFIAYLRSLNTDDSEEELYELAEERMNQAFKHVTKGFEIDVDHALQLLQNLEDDNITQEDKGLQSRLVAATDNLINFSVCQQYQLAKEVMEWLNDADLDFTDADIEELMLLCKKYNDTYSLIENGDICYAAIIARKWLKFSDADYLVYWTMNDAKVRPWHMALQGYAAHPDEFPSWMIPPIEYNCRCYLDKLEFGGGYDKLHLVQDAVKKAKKPEQLSDVYSESLAKCGKIFGDSHPYFAVGEADKEMLKGFVERLKVKYYG